MTRGEARFNRENAYNLITEMLQNKNLQKHGLAVEAIMRALCSYLKEKHPELPIAEFNSEEWGIVGLLHDGDYELVEKNPEKHTLVMEEKLRPLGVSERIINGIKAHHNVAKPNRENLMEKAVYCADELAGLITACALVQPEKKISSVTLESVLKKFKQANFAAGANREQIRACETELEIPLEKFIEISLLAMQNISNELGL